MPARWSRPSGGPAANRRASIRRTARSAFRLARCDGVLLPGGGDIAPHRYGAYDTHDSVYDVDETQDAFDLGGARVALDLGLPLLVMCRGLQVVNVALGGTLEQDMGGPRGAHRHVVHPVAIRRGTLLERATGARKVDASCFHHQRVNGVAAGLAVTARAADGTVEGFELPGAAGWFSAVQWHPEDTAHEDIAQQQIFDALVRAARHRQRVGALYDISQETPAGRGQEEITPSHH